MSKIVDKSKEKISNFATGEEGSIFWLIRWTINMTKVVVESINDQMRMMSASRSQKKKELEDNEE